MMFSIVLISGCAKSPCMDVSHLLSEGYENNGIDSNGCQLIKKTITTNSSELYYNLSDIVMTKGVLNSTLITYSKLNISNLMYEGQHVQWVYQNRINVVEGIEKIIPCIILENNTRLCQEDLPWIKN